MYLIRIQFRNVLGIISLVPNPIFYPLCSLFCGYDSVYGIRSLLRSHVINLPTYGTFIFVAVHGTVKKSKASQIEKSERLKYFK